MVGVWGGIQGWAIQGFEGLSDLPRRARKERTGSWVVSIRKTRGPLTLFLVLLKRDLIERVSISLRVPLILTPRGLLAGLRLALPAACCEGSAPPTCGAETCATLW